ncbi:metal ABC transporter permease [Aureliella helgolandensis]|uniref:Manganese transport system membrane protein MntB n=1 Tax=Aureliella helgolandensis TaxID=2527968 RepID=A0A518G037_9BACT|nr:iron chelate uptake ABC transporter family permease subunit [Aureliella helgolandensis]QDV21961.1 Manganese transport system membrane protein MntB [Aureliella helgolandensis]
MLSKLLADVNVPLVLADQTNRILRIILLQDLNTRVVLLGTFLLGIAAGVLGVYLLLRRRVLIGDAISHSTLPGVALAFLWTTGADGSKSLPILLLGAAISGALGGASVLLLRNLANMREDAALGIVLSVFFGAGVALVSVVQRVGGNVAGLEAFIYGKAASMTPEDVWLSGGAAFIVLCVVLLLGKELKILCFDAEFARSQGWPVLLLDSLLIGLVVAVTIVGLQAVGLILIIALLVIPAASARFWTHDLKLLLWLAGSMGGVSCAAGTLVSASFDRMPSGASIVLAGCSLFLLSFVFGTQRGVLWRATRMIGMRREQNFQHFLRAAYEELETQNAIPLGAGELKTTEPVMLEKIRQRRFWTLARVRIIAKQMSRAGLVVFGGGHTARLTPRGMVRALATVRDHRLLEHYMMDQAEAKVGEADREADYLEHGLLPEHLAELSGALDPTIGDIVPPNPHAQTDRNPKAENE